jgi:hypothetical protein
MRHTIRVYTVLAAALALQTVLHAQAKPDFSGTWVLVLDKSDFGQMPAPATMTRTITHKDPSFKVVTMQTGGAMGDTTVETTFTTDGKPATNTVQGSQMSTTAKWDGSAITFHSSINVQDTDSTIDDRYELSDAGKTLTVMRTFTTPDGPLATKLVMKKQ